jgi:hypothetical protein
VTLAVTFALPVRVSLYPWSRALRRFVSPGALPAVDPAETPMSFALVLDDGTRCVLRAGDEWGGRADGLFPAYGCGMTSWSYAVLASPDQAPVANHPQRS